LNRLDKVCIQGFVAGLILAPLPAFALGSASPVPGGGGGGGGAGGAGGPRGPSGGLGPIAGGDANFSTIASNVIASVSELPGLLSGLAYMFGLLLGVMGVVKIKSHVDNPRQTELKEALIRLGCGGALMALPIVYEAMHVTVGTNGQNATAPVLVAATFNIGGP
jgi:hypothetical protein